MPLRRMSKRLELLTSELWLKNRTSISDVRMVGTSWQSTARNLLGEHRSAGGGTFGFVFVGIGFRPSGFEL